MSLFGVNMSECDSMKERERERERRNEGVHIAQQNTIVWDSIFVSVVVLH